MLREKIWWGRYTGDSVEAPNICAVVVGPTGQLKLRYQYWWGAQENKLKSKIGAFMGAPTIQSNHINSWEGDIHTTQIQLQSR